ncbi:rhodanese-like domain-containing protein [Ignavibacterium sp.]|uniref:rhodanese-like domain-containing protein n=1 Tax=Ignavibacterium sp. TaxID=2651167 RepID=UPI00307F7E5B
MNKKNIYKILIISSIIGLVYNFLNPNGVPLIREERKLTFVEEENLLPVDSSTFSIDSTSITKTDNDVLNKDEKKIDSTSQKSSNEILTVKENFSKPLAIKIDKAYQLFKQGVKFIDARMPEEFAEGHIKGAINIPFDGDESYRNVLNSFSKEEILVTYCSGTECDLSILLGDELFEKGFKKVYIFFGGWNDWVERNYPISKGSE